MRRPLFMVCLCLVVLAALRSALFHSSGTDSLPSDEEWIIVTGKVYQKDTDSFSLKTIALSEAQTKKQSEMISYVASSRQNIPFEYNLICEYDPGENLQDNALDMPSNSGYIPLGSTVTLQGVFHTFSSATNPGEFDVREYYQTQQIGGKLTDVTVLAVSSDYSEWKECLYQVRTYFSRRLYKVFPQKEASILAAMLLGDKEQLDKGVQELYKENGIIHILSISGLHITMIGMSIYRSLRKAGVPIWLAALGGGGILCLYGVMTGMSVSACRAIGMYLIRMLAEVVGRTYDMLTALGVLAAIMAWHNPANLQNAGFLLSFGSVMGVGWFYPALLPKEKGNVREKYEPCKWKRKVKRAWKNAQRGLLQSILAGTSITLFTLPIQLWFYYEVPVYSIFINLLVLPFMSTVMGTGMLVLLLPGTGILGTIPYLILQGYEVLCEWFDKLPFHSWNPGKPEVWQVVVYYLILFCIVCLREYGTGLLHWMNKKADGRRPHGYLGNRTKRLQRYFGDRIRRMGGLLWTPAMLTLAVILLSVHVRTGTTVTFLDVGQGDCIVMEMGSGEVFVFDCGSTGRSQVGEYVLLPFLKYKGIRYLDAVFVSHPDADHCNGIEELLGFASEEEIEIGQLVLPEIAESMKEDAFSDIVEDVQRGFPPRVVYISAGDSFATQGATFLCLHPPGGYEIEDANTYSQCFYVEIYGNGKNNIVGGGSSRIQEDAPGKEPASAFSLLLTGDVEGEGEALLLQELKDRDIINVTVLKVAHHGSRNATGEELLSQISPAYAVISCGRNNSYGHPHAELLERLDTVGTGILTTPEYGAIMVEIGNQIEIYTYIK